MLVSAPVHASNDVHQQSCSRSRGWRDRELDRAICNLPSENGTYMHRQSCACCCDRAGCTVLFSWAAQAVLGTSSPMQRLIRIEQGTTTTIRLLYDALFACQSLAALESLLELSGSKATANLLTMSSSSHRSTHCKQSAQKKAQRAVNYHHKNDVNCSQTLSSSSRLYYRHLARCTQDCSLLPLKQQHQTP